MSALLLRNALCVSALKPGLHPASVRVSEGAIAAVGADLHPEPADRVEDLHGALLLPGLVCAHTHLYSSLSRGMPGPPHPPASFPEMLELIWWKLDRALDDELIWHSALAGALEAVRCGVTTLVDHHSSPNAIPGSLATIARALTTVGMRGILCYETSDRDGMERRDQGLAENEAFVSERRHDPMIRGLVGAHASFTLSDQTLSLIGSLVERLNGGVHIHVAEDRADETRTRECYGRGIMERLEDHGLVRSFSVFAHAVHVGPAGFDLLRKRRTWLIHNPRSNMNNGVGHAPLHLFGDRSALGTDGFPPDMFEELRAGWFRNRETEPRLEPADLVRMLFGGSELASEVFGFPIGRIAPGAAADLVVMDYQSPTPLTAENVPFHLLFGLRSSMVHSVMIGGSWVMRERNFVHLDEARLLREASAAAARLWSRMHE